MSTVSSNTNQSSSPDIESCPEPPAGKNTADYPDWHFHSTFLRLFAHFPLPQTREGCSDVNDLSFHVLYAAPVNEKNCDKIPGFLSQVRALIQDVVGALNCIEAPGKKQLEGDRLAKEIGARQAAAEEVCHEIRNETRKTDSGLKMLKE